jgi:hypothetical protein
MSNKITSILWDLAIITYCYLSFGLNNINKEVKAYTQTLIQQDEKEEEVDYILNILLVVTTFLGGNVLKWDVKSSKDSSELTCCGPSLDVTEHGRIVLVPTP